MAFANFVLELGSNPAALAQFHKQPDAAASAAGLSAAEAAILKSGDPVTIRQAVSASVGSLAAASGETDIVIVVVLAPAPQTAQAFNSLARFRQNIGG